VTWAVPGSVVAPYGDEVVARYCLVSEIFVIKTYVRQYLPARSFDIANLYLRAAFDCRDTATPPGIRVTYHGDSIRLSLSRDIETGKTE
jgi:hypothetical protein